MKKLVAAVALSVAFVGVQAQTVIFDNTTTPLGFYWGQLDSGAASSIEAGDQLLFGGTDRDLVGMDIDITVAGGADMTSDITLRLYDNTNPPSAGTMFYSATQTSLLFLAGSSTMSWVLPNVTAPDEIIYTLQFNNASGHAGSAGPRLFDPPTVGSSGNFFWADDGGWSTLWFGAGGPVANFNSTWTAVPEPASMIALGLGLAALVSRRRRKKA